MPNREIEVRYKATSDDAQLQQFLSHMKQAETGTNNAAVAAKNASGSFESMGSSMKAHLVTIAAWAAGLYGVRQGIHFLIGLSKDAMEQAMAQQKADHGLADALARTGQNVDELLPKLKAYASELQRATGYGDEQSEGIMERLTRFGLEGEILKRTTKLVLDATAAGKDEAGVTELLGRAYQGRTEALSRYGIVIKDGLPLQEKYNAALEGAERLWGGKAEESAKTFEGRIRTMKAAWGDLLETVGLAITNNTKVGAAIQYVTDRLTDYSGQATDAEGRTAALSSKIDTLALQVVNVGRFVTNMGLGIAALAVGIASGISFMFAKLIEGVGYAAEKTNTIMARIYSAIPGQTKSAELFERLARGAKQLRDTGADWAKSSDEQWSSMKNHLQEANDGWDKLERTIREAKAAADKHAPSIKPPKPQEDPTKAATEEESIRKKAMADILADAIDSDLRRATEEIDLIKKTEKRRIAEAHKAEMLINRDRARFAQEEEQRIKDLEKQREHWNKIRATNERQLYGQLTGLASQYGGKSIQQLIAIAGAAEQLYDLWQTIQTIFFAKKKIEEITDAITAQTLAKGQGTTKTTAAANEYAVNAAASVAAIPYVGWAMAPGVYAEALATGLASAAAIAALPIIAVAEKGYDIPANVDPLIQAHRREMVLPADIADGFRAFFRQPRTSTSYRGPTIYYSPTNLFGPEKDRGLRKVAKMLEPAQRYNAKNVIKAKPRASKATGRGL